MRYRSEDDEGDGSDLKEVLEKVHGFYTTLFNNTDQAMYSKVEFSVCDDDGFRSVLNYLPLLFWLLQYLYKHTNGGQAKQVGLKDWQNMKTYETGSDLYKWLMDQEDKSKVTEKNDPEHRLRSGVDLLKRGFDAGDMNGVQGEELNNKLEFVDGTFTHLMKGLFLNKPWRPGKVGDMCAFLEGFCSVMNNDAELKTAFEKKVGKKYPRVNSEDLTEKLQAVKKDLDELTTKLTPINKIIYQGISQKHADKYLDIVMGGITGFMGDLKEMQVSMGTWKENEDDSDPELSRSRFHYGFKDFEKDKEIEINKAIEKLTGNNGSLDLLVDLLISAHMTDASTGSASDNSGSIAGGLLGTTAFLGGGGGAYAFNLFGFGDTVHKLFSRPVTLNLRG